MAAAYRVTAPYVVLKVMDPVSGTAMVNGFYRGAIVTEDRVHADSLKRHLDRGWLELFEPVAEPAPEPEIPEPSPDEVPDGTADEVRAWVGDDSERAMQALVAEEAGKKRSTLIDHLTKLAGL